MEITTMTQPQPAARLRLPAGVLAGAAVAPSADAADGAAYAGTAIHGVLCAPSPVAKFGFDVSGVRSWSPPV